MDSRITQTAHELALKFEVDSDIPERFKSGKSKAPSDKIFESQVEKRFQKHLNDWIETINSILEHTSDTDQAWRFIRIDPKINDNSINDVTQCQDYLDFTKLFIQRRNIDLCGPNELGNLARLHLAFERKIETKIINSTGHMNISASDIGNANTEYSSTAERKIETKIIDSKGHMNFLALDLETANADYSSICQIGIVQIENGSITDKWSTLINPRAYFDPFNISVHGIKAEDVKDAPSFDQIYSELSKRISNQITVHHMPFDKTAISRACIDNKLNLIDARWLDSAKIVRRTWDQFAYRGYGLGNVASFLKIEFEHHDALEDAITAAKVVLHACEKNQISIEEWFTRIDRPLNSIDTGPVKIHFEGNPQGSLLGETMVFTGALALSRLDAAKIAANLGCHVDSSVTKNTTILVVGTQDTSKLAGYEKSSKHRKAEDLIHQGFPIKILSERDFIEMCKSENCN